MARRYPRYSSARGRRFLIRSGMVRISHEDRSLKSETPDFDPCLIFPGVQDDEKLRRQLRWYERWVEWQLESMPESYFSVLPRAEVSAGQRCSRPFLEAFREVAEYSQSAASVTIDDLVNHLQAKGLVEIQTTPEDRRRARTFVFGVLGWQTMLYRASIGNCPPELFEIADEQGGYRGQSFMALRQSEAACARKRLPDFLMGFGLLLATKNLCLSVEPEELQSFNQLLVVNPSEFNAYLLSSLGHIQIKWVDTLSCHMDFNPLTKELYLFRFPSFCQACLPAARTESKRKSVIYSCAEKDGGHDQWASEKEVACFLREIMLSYRLLFGQTKKSRDFFRSMDPFIDLPGDIKDPLLPLLGGARSRRVGQNADQKETYHLVQDFPILRSRIVTLHQHLSTTKPRGWAELWHDRRNSAQWLTFWAVIAFGGLGLFFAFLQTVLQILQIALGR